MKPRCKNCVYGTDIYNRNGDMICKRNPPDKDGEFSVCYPDWSCGEYRNKKTVAHFMESLTGIADGRR